jgi:Asp-tRNA(Asn)/Glu-tRNA(Gln) amidotransferase A subunit family amidase
MTRTYNLETIKSPRLCGDLLDIFSRILRIPIIGQLILELIKRKNQVTQMIAFANRPHPCQGSGSNGELLPLYYPIHEMTVEEKEMHEKMVKEAPLDLHQLSTRINQPQQRNEDYTTRYKNRTITPSQVAEKLIKAIQGMDKSVVCQFDATELRLQAAESTRRYLSGNIMGVLDGVPVLIKDEIPTLGFITTKGTSFLTETTDKDVYPIMKLKDEGAMIVGKTNQHEIGIGTTGFNLFYGTPKNPYGRDHHYYTGGSSSGSAAAVSMGLVPLAIGADGGGSIRIPSSLCGCVGLKPTFKRIAIDMAVGCSVCHVGPMTNNIQDSALAYAIMAGAATDDHRHQSQKQPSVHLHAFVSNFNNPSLMGLRIGIFDEHVNDAKPNVRAATRRAIEYYRSQGAEIIPITLPHLGEIHLAHGITITTEMFSLMEQHYHSPHFDEMCPETRVSLALGKSWSGSEFLAAQKVRSFAMKHVEDLFQNKVDVIVSPGTPCCAPILKADALSNGESNLSETGALMRYMIHGNFTGLPAIVFPIAYDDETSLPISLQVQAAHWREDLLFRVAEKSQNILTNGVRKPTMYVNVLEE